MTEPNHVNRREFRFVGMSRSGNHAIINWVLQQIEGRACFLNCVEPRHNPYDSARPARLGGAAYESNFQLDLDAERAGRNVAKDYLLYSYEDCYLGMVADESFEQRHDEWVGPSGERRDILILRDPFNLFASRRKSGMYRTRAREDEPNLVTFAQARRIWKQHAREYAHPGRYLMHRPLAISFNRWAAEEGYRRQIAESLDLPFSDKGAKIVPATAGGSSFDGTRFSGDAQSMAVLHRWEHYKDDSSFWEEFDEETRRYAQEIFGPLPELARSRS